MRGRSLLAATPLLLGVAFGAGANAQTVVRADERLAPDRPESWAMNYVSATSFMTAFGATPDLAAGELSVAAEFGTIPHLDQSQRRVGFRGFKEEDLNKSPVFGRVRVWLGLPDGYVAEFAYTPPMEIDGAKPERLFAAAIATRVLERGRFVLSARLFGQHGAVRGDVTCPERLAGVRDGGLNPYGCEAPSKDRLRMNHYGVEATASWAPDPPWEWHAGIGVVRTEPEVQVDALTRGVRDRSRLVTKDMLPYFAFGVGRKWGREWRLALEVLHVPLQVRRQANEPRERDPLTSIRLQVRYGLE